MFLVNRSSQGGGGISNAGMSTIHPLTAKFQLFPRMTLRTGIYSHWGYEEIGLKSSTFGLSSLTDPYHQYEQHRRKGK